MGNHAIYKGWVGRGENARGALYQGLVGKVICRAMIGGVQADRELRRGKEGRGRGEEVTWA